MSTDGSGYEGNGTQLEEAPPWLRGLHATTALTVMLTSLVGNALVLVLVFRYKELHYRSIFASMGTVVVNMAFSLFTNPQVLAGSVTGQWPFGDTACSVVGFATVSLFYVRWLNTCLIALDRFLNVVAPFFYERNSKRFLTALTVVVWTVPFFSVIPTLWLGGGFTYRPTLMFCSQKCADEDLTCVHIFVAMFGAYLLVGVLVPTFLYLYLYCLGLKKRWSMKRNQRLGTHLQSTPTENGLQLDSRPARAQHLKGEGEEGKKNSSELNVHILKAVNHLAEEEEEEEGCRRLNGGVRQHGVENGLNLTDLKFTADMFAERESQPCNGSLLPPSGYGNLHVTQDTTHSGDYVTQDTSHSGDHVIQDTVSHNGIHTSHNGVHTCTSNNGDRPKETEAKKNQRTSQDLRSLSPQSPHSRRGSLFAIFTLLKPVRPQWTREKQAMTTFIIIFISLVVTQFPLYLVVTNRRTDWYPQIPLWVHFLCVNLYFLAPALEPIIIMRSRDFKSAMSKLFTRRGSFLLPSS